MGMESLYAIKEPFNHYVFLMVKVRHPAVKEALGFSFFGSNELKSVCLQCAPNLHCIVSNSTWHTIVVMECIYTHKYTVKNGYSETLPGKFNSLHLCEILCLKSVVK